MSPRIHIVTLFRSIARPQQEILGNENFPNLSIASTSLSLCSSTTSNGSSERNYSKSPQYLGHHHLFHRQSLVFQNQDDVRTRTSPWAGYTIVYSRPDTAVDTAVLPDHHGWGTSREWNRCPQSGKHRGTLGRDGRHGFRKLFLNIEIHDTAFRAAQNSRQAASGGATVG